MTTEIRREYDYSKLRGKIISNGYTLETFAQKIPMTPQNLSKKLNNKSVLNSCQIERMAELLMVNNAEEFVGLFFSHKN